MANLLMAAAIERVRHNLRTSLMSRPEIESIAFRDFYVLNPRPLDRKLSNYLVVALDSEYILPIHIPDNVKDSDVPLEYKEPRPVFRTFQFACQGKVTHWKPDRPISTTELCVWILENLVKWGIDHTQYKAIVVCSHWLLAEAQHFTDVKEKFKSWGNTLYGEVSFEPGEWTNFNPSEPDVSITFEKTRFKFVDTYTLFGMKLETLTNASPYPKIRDDEMWHGQVFKYWRANPHLHFKEDQEHFWAYAESDCLGLLWCVEYWRNWVWNKWSIDILRTRTFSSIGLRLLKARLKEPTEPFVPFKHTNVYDPEKLVARRYFLEGYAAAIRTSDQRGLIPGPVYYYDVSKEYTTAAIMQPLPGPHAKYLKIGDHANLRKYEGVLHIRFEFPPNTKNPCLPVKDVRFPKLICPLKGETTCGVAEVRLAKRLGAKIYIITSCVFKPNKTAINHPLRQVLEEVLALANDFKQKGDKAGETFMKNIANGVIGKLFQRNKLEITETVAWSDKATKASKSSWSPIWASLILSRARSILSEILTLGTPVYCHTDSIFSRTKINPDAPILKNLRKHGSEGLLLKSTFKRFWTPRAACYYGETEDGQIRTARQGLSGIREHDFIQVIQPKIGNPKSENHTKFVSLRMATFKDKWLDKNLVGHEVVSLIETDFEYDHKRRLDNSDANLWTEPNQTYPWKTMDELANTIPAKGTKRTTTIQEKSQRKRGRPRMTATQDLDEMVRLHEKEGLTRRQITLRFKDKYSPRTIYRAMEFVKYTYSPHSRENTNNGKHLKT